MKIRYIADDELEEIRNQLKGKPSKPEKPKLDHKLISKIGKGLYGFDQAREVSIRVKLKDGTSIAFNRSTDQDRFDAIRQRLDEEDEDD